MKPINLLLAIMAMTVVTNTATAQSGESRILVAWYSWGGNTETVGKFIQQVTGADIFIIEPVEAYSTDYRTCTEEAKAEIEADCTRPIKGRVPDMGKYDIVIIGTPNWWSTMAPPVLEFIRRHDLSGKTVAPFITHGGGREARSFSDMERTAPEARFVKGFAVPGNSAADSRPDVEKWLTEIGIIR